MPSGRVDRDQYLDNWAGGFGDSQISAANGPAALSRAPEIDKKNYETLWYCSLEPDIAENLQIFGRTPPSKMPGLTERLRHYTNQIERKNYG